MPGGRALPASRVALDPSQAEAVTAPPGPLLVLASAGSGKTRVLTERAAALLMRDGLPAAAVLVLTFTNRAADELRDRLEVLVGSAARRMTIGTFHAVCHRMLRAHGERVGRTARFSVYDAEQSRRLIAQALKRAGAGEELPARVVALQIGQAKARLLGPREYGALRDNDVTRRVASIFALYEEALARADALDFDDLLTRAVRLLDQPDLRSHYQRRWRALLVDEYQDTNPAQYEWLRRLAWRHRNITVAGDEDQAIYHWRGADVSNLRRFERDFADARVVALARNYRSSGAIVAAAGRLVLHNRQRIAKTMWTDAPPGPAVTVVRCVDEREESRTAAAWCRARLEQGVAAEQLAVLVRTRGQLQALEDALVLSGVRCRVVGGQGLWETQSVRDLVAHLTLLVNPRDELALVRALLTRPGVGEVSVGRVLGAASGYGGDLLATCVAAREIDGLGGRQCSAIEAFGRALRERRDAGRNGVGATCTDTVLASGLAERLARERTDRSDEQLARLRRFCRSARGYEASSERPELADFLAQSALAADDGEERAPGRVTLSTLHAAKGREWDHVRIAGLCEGLLPHDNALRRGEIDEERRLAYVGITRARSELALSWPRTYRGRLTHPSRFLAEAGVGAGEVRPSAQPQAA
jgi:DNA helicase II / ATP-dependent DNA helicase PcrA